jgi:hypothetical protein
MEELSSAALLRRLPATVISFHDELPSVDSNAFERVGTA